MPMGAIVRLFNHETCPPTIGSFTTLYGGVQKLSRECFSTEACREMLLAPKNAAENVLQNLKLNVNSTEPTRFRCLSGHMSTFKNTRCACGFAFSRKVEPGFNPLASVGAGFVSTCMKFNISDDLRVSPASYDAFPTLLHNLGIYDFKALYFKTVTVGLEEIRGLLKICLLSQSTLTDMFLRDKCVTTKHSLSKQVRFKTDSGTSPNSRQMSINIIIHKADNKILFAEASEDFVDLLFSFLTFPIGLVSNLLGGKSSVKCLDNLYNSVSSVERFIGSNQLKEALLCPKLLPSYVTRNQLLVDTDTSSVKNVHYLGVPHIFIDTHSSIANYVKGPVTFLVKDNLHVELFSTISSIRLLSSLNADLSLVEKRVISVGRVEALSILQAALISESALTIGLNTILKKPKQESC